MAAFPEVCRRELELCGVGEGVTVAVLSQGDLRRAYAETFLAVAQSLGATAFELRLPQTTAGIAIEGGAWTLGQTPLADNRPALETLKQVDLVIDLVLLLFSKEQLEIQEAGARILLVLEPPDVLTRLFPVPVLRERAEAGAELLGQASTLRVTSPHGTDVTYKLGAYPAMTQYGFTDTPGRWDHWPSGFLFTSAKDDGVDGTVVIAPGDSLLPFKRYVQDAITVTMEAGMIVDIRGDGLDARIVKDYMEGFDDPKAFAVSHIGWGCDERARWSELATDTRGTGVEARSVYGNVMFSTGPNQELGGSNDTACHLDIPMMSCSLYLDDEPVVVDGDIVAKELSPNALEGATVKG